MARDAVAAFLEIEPSIVRHLPRSSVQALCALIEVMSNSGVPNAVAGLHEELVQLRFAARISDDLARRDHLTGLGNRRALDERLELEIARARRYGRDLSVVLVDVDNLKRVNDSLGHAAGGRVLRAVGARLVASVRETDFVARFGGDEMVVVCPETSGDAVADLTSKIMAMVAATPVLAMGSEVRISASAGSATLRRNQGHSELMEDVDLALYRCKNAGRGRGSGSQPGSVTGYQPFGATVVVPCAAEPPGGGGQLLRITHVSNRLHEGRPVPRTLTQHSEARRPPGGRIAG